MENKLKENLFHLLAEKGAKLMGIADLSGIGGAEMRTGVAVAVPLPPKIIRDLQNAPTLEYYDAYHALNKKLDEIVSCGAAFLRKHGYAAAAHTTKTVQQDADWRTPLPHKTVATRHGELWQRGTAVQFGHQRTAASRRPGYGKPLRQLHSLRTELSRQGFNRDTVDAGYPAGSAPAQGSMQKGTD